MCEVEDLMAGLRIWEFIVAFLRLIGGCFPTFRLRLTWGQDNSETEGIVGAVRGEAEAER